MPYPPSHEAPFALEFACRDASGGLDLCFNGGSCLPNATSRFTGCVCPEGFTADVEWFHFPNCARPADMPRTMFIAFAVMFPPWFAYLILKVYPGLNRDMTIVARITLLFWICLFTLPLAVFLENGCFTMCAVTGSATFLVGDIMCCKVLIMTLNPLFALQRKPFKRPRLMIVIWTIIMGMLIVTSGIAMCVFTRDDSRRDSYNISAMISTSTVWLGGIADLSFIVFTSSKLEFELSKMVAISAQVVDTEVERNARQFASGAAKGSRPYALSQESVRQEEAASSIIRLITRLRFLKLGVLAILVPFACLFIAVPIVFTQLGSVPFFYILVYVQFACSMGFGIGFIFFVKKSPPSVFWSFSSSMSSPLSVTSPLIKSLSGLKQLSPQHLQTPRASLAIIAEVYQGDGVVDVAKEEDGG